MKAKIVCERCHFREKDGSGCTLLHQTYFACTVKEFERLCPLEIAKRRGIG